MSLKSSNQVEPNRYQLEVEVDADTFEKAVNQAFHKQSKKISIPGFRKGKAPRAFIEKYYGEQVFYEDAINAVYPAALDQAVKEAGLEFIEDKIDFDVVKAGKDGLDFKATITTKPDVSIENYKGLEATKKAVSVTDADVDEEIKKVQDRDARMVTVEDRPAQNGDSVVIDFEGFLDGVPFEGGKAENHTLSLGSGQFIPGFEEQVVGHSTGEEFDVNVTFPEDYHAQELKGKPVVFKVKLHEIKKKELPEVDDDFVKDVSSFDTLAEYREDIRKKLLESREKAANDEMENQLIDKLVDLVKGEIPEAMYQNKISEDIRDFGYRLQSQGLDLQTYLKYTGKDKDSIRDSFRPQAERQVKVRLALEKIAKLEGIKPADEDIDKEYEKLAKAYEMDVEKVKGIVAKEDLAMDLAVEQAVKVVRDNAKITEVKEEEKQEEKKEEKEEAKEEAKAE
ncbi:prolyl isomerase (trigger factor) [Ruminococcaceae bacterium BL-6]|nr:prolyl isomerase (trigger factor) [Ruminococcaceae bacterium BL-6]